MDTRAVPPAPDIAPTTTTVRRVASVMAAPTLWLVHLIVSFALVRYACESDANWLLHALSAVALGLAAAATWVGWRVWRAEADARDGEADRVRFMAAVGVANSALFTAIIALSWIAGFAIAPCDLV